MKKEKPLTPTEKINKERDISFKNEYEFFRSYRRNLENIGDKMTPILQTMFVLAGIIGAEFALKACMDYNNEEVNAQQPAPQILKVTPKNQAPHQNIQKTKNNER